ncbi:MAG: nucleoside 2-deoxyribosyltransferase [Mycobacterium kyogaense]|uniref:nucleoside 2-deoxyribosyltransferase n=1 Tax=Mycobacterium kyogaense TaxID=2212479 RepID=UPI002FF83643
MRIYLAAPLFTGAERAFNLSLCKAIESVAHVYLPQRDGLLLAEERRSSAERSISQKIFQADIAAISAADALVAVVDGAAVDDGVAFELGFAFAHQKVCIGYTSDSRRAEGYFRNPMWVGSLAAGPFDSEFGLIEYLSVLARGYAR